MVPLGQPETSSSATSTLDDSSHAPLAPSPPVRPVLIIKDKAADLSFKDIIDKVSWTEAAKKIIDARLLRPPYCPGPDSKALITTPENQHASSWWEEVFNFYVKSPISNLFIEESHFNGKGFKMIKYIDKYFNPPGAIDSLGHIFDLIDIQRGTG